MAEGRLDAILYGIAALIAALTVRGILRKSKPSAAPPVKPAADDTEVKRRLALLEAMLDQVRDPP